MCVLPAIRSQYSPPDKIWYWIVSIWIALYASSAYTGRTLSQTQWNIHTYSYRYNIYQTKYRYHPKRLVETGIRTLIKNGCSFGLIVCSFQYWSLFYIFSALNLFCNIFDSQRCSAEQDLFLGCDHFTHLNYIAISPVETQNQLKQFTLWDGIIVTYWKRVQLKSVPR